jgi:predicted nucleic acid-binding protein
VKAVSDTSPLGYLILIGQPELLSKTFSSISIPEQVRDELLDERAPEAIRRWMSAPPGWLTIVAVDDTGAPPEFARLHSGERAAILLAERLNADILLLDEKAARAVASLRGLHLSGTLGILADAGRRKLVDLPQAVADLQKTSFRARPDLLRKLLEQES